jgi:hypothetical protein
MGMKDIGEPSFPFDPSYLGKGSDGGSMSPVKNITNEIEYK